MILFNQRNVSLATSHVRLAIMPVSVPLAPKVTARINLEKILDSALTKKKAFSLKRVFASHAFQAVMSAKMVKNVLNARIHST